MYHKNQRFHVGKYTAANGSYEIGFAVVWDGILDGRGDFGDGIPMEMVKDDEIHTEQSGMVTKWLITPRCIHIDILIQNGLSW